MLNTEARTIDADVLSRRCVLMRLLDFSYEQYQKALRQSAGAVVIILPRAMAAVPQDVIRVSVQFPSSAQTRARELPQKKEHWVWSQLGDLGHVASRPCALCPSEGGMFASSSPPPAPRDSGPCLGSAVLRTTGELLAASGRGWGCCSE